MDSSSLIPSDPPDEKPERENHEDTTAPAGGQNGGHRRQQANESVPDRQTCLNNLARIAGLVAIKAISPAQANAMKSAYAEILRALDTERNSHAVPFADEDLLRGFREQPELFKLLEPLLTDEQVALVIAEVATDEPR